MNNQAKSNNSNRGSSFRDFIVPTFTDVLLYALIAGLLLFALNAKALWVYFTSDYLTHVTIGQIIGVHENVNNFVTNVSQGRALQVIFWALVGIIAYILIWILRNVFVNLRNDVVADEYLHPPGYSRTGYWSSVIGRKIFFGVLLVVFLAYIYASVNMLAGLSKLVKSSVEDFALTPSITKIAGAWLFTMFMLYIIVLLVKLALSSWRAIYTDL